MTTIAEHTIDLSLLPERANILDLGCLGFLFTNHMRGMGHTVKAIDIQDLEGEYSMVAVSNFSGTAYIKYSKDQQAACLSKEKTRYEIACVTLQELSRYFNIPFWDLIKIDVEGSEYEIIMSLTKPPATQLSIEFHLHTGIYKDAQVKEMEDKLLSLGYFPVKHDKYPAHGLQANYWDSLWILK